MKTYNKPAASKLVTRFDKELRAILMSDLKAIKARNQFVNGVQNNQLSAA